MAGDVIVELVAPDRGEPTTDEPTSAFGLALVAVVGWFVYRRWGGEARTRFDDWVADPALTLARLEQFVADPTRAGRPKSYSLG